MYNENELLMRLWENTKVTLTGAAADAIASISASVATGLYEKFKNANRVCFQVSCAVSANNAGIEGTMNNNAWYRLLTVSGLGVTSGYSDMPYINYRGFIDTYSSGTVSFDFIQNK